MIAIATVTVVVVLIAITQLMDVLKSPADKWAGKCVRFDRVSGKVEETSCSGAANGRVSSVVSDESACPGAASPIRLVADPDKVLCITAP